MARTTTKIPFSSRKLDAYLTAWLAEGPVESDREDWTRLLTYDAKIREQFCDWIKSLREPGETHFGKRGGRT
ncbi:MAG: hypothetical protein JST16_02375 [Bdellovibrionales bacterium]|nr:hypothetical protein [Bdellovibrionales bacterium]